MTTGTTTLLSLALPVEGELDGTWGDVVNYGITDYVDIAVAGTLTLTGDGAVSLTNTAGTATATNIVSSLSGVGTASAQFAVIKVTGTLTTTKVITALSGAGYSKTYIVANTATGGSVTIKASGQTGVTVASGDRVTVYFNGTDYALVAGGPINLATQVTGVLPAVNGGTGLSSTGANGNILTSNGTTWTSAPNTATAAAGGSIFVNNDVISTSYTIASGQNGFSVGPMTISSGYAITVSSGQRWVIL
jgi:hypothetical protein